MIIDLDALANKSHIAMAIGKSQQAVSKLAKKIGLSRTATNGELLEAIFSRLSDEAAGRGGEAQQELTQARIRESLAKAQSSEISNLQSLGALVAVEDIEPLLEQWATVARAEVANALNKIIADIEGEHDIEIDQDVLNGHINSAYRIIGDYPGRDPASDQADTAGDAEPGGEEVDPA